MERLLITIGRQYGSGGREVGKRLADRLGIDLYGKPELMELAKGRPDYQEVRAFYEEQPVNSLLYAIAMNQAEEPARRAPFEGIRKLCQERSCVLIGRCGNYIFRKEENCARIFLYAGMEEKIRWLTQRERLSEKKAEARIRKMEEERARFHQYYTGESWGNVNHYDLCVDTGILGTEKTVEVICGYLENRGMIRRGK